MVASFVEHRTSGLLCHLTSLPSAFGIGDLGRATRSFLDFMAEAGITVWQILPLSPTDPATGNSPYSSRSAFAANPMLIDPEDLVDRGLLSASDLEEDRPPAAGPVDYDAVQAYKHRLLERAFEAFRTGSNAAQREDFERFCREQAGWLRDYVLFVVLKARHGGKAWWDWDRDLAHRDAGALARLEEELEEDLAREQFVQYLFFSQYRRLKKEAKERGVRILGDLPIYVSQDSADVWAHPDLFKLDGRGRPTVVAGVPPDYFSTTGQLWGNPVYDWEGRREAVFAWWTERMAHSLELFDLVRIDHFRGFASYWEVPAHHRTAVHGRWVPGPGPALFEHFQSRFGSLPLVAEDLGTITEDVRDLMAQFQIPGCRVLLFAFGDDMPDNPHRPDNHAENAVVYTGTHDNNTARGWFEEETDHRIRQRLAAALGHDPQADHIAWDLVRLAYSSPARLAMIPVQDILGLGSDARMNKPATAKGNWRWRMGPEDLPPDLAARVKDALSATGRLG